MKTFALLLMTLIMFDGCGSRKTMPEKLSLVIESRAAKTRSDIGFQLYYSNCSTIYRKYHLPHSAGRSIELDMSGRIPNCILVEASDRNGNIVEKGSFRLDSSHEIIRLKLKPYS